MAKLNIGNAKNLPQSNSAVGGADGIANYTEGWNYDSLEFLKYFRGHTVFVSMKDQGDQKPWHFHNGFNECVQTMDKRNKDGDEGRCGAFFTVNAMDESRDEGRHRTAKMVTTVRAAFMDDDIRRDVSDWRKDWDEKLPPSLIVESSPGKFHYYWLIVNDGMNIVDNDEKRDEWQRVQMKLVRDYGGDKSARDLARYLRLPGSINWKESAKFTKPGGIIRTDKDGNENPEDTQWVVRWRVGRLDGAPYAWQGIKNSIGMVDESEVRRTGNSGGIGLAHKEDSRTEQEMINAIKNAEGYHDNLRDLAYGNKQDGLSDYKNIEMLRGIMLQVKEELKDERWKARWDDIPRVVHDCERITKEDVENGKAVNLEELGRAVTTEEELRSGHGREIPLPPNGKMRGMGEWSGMCGLVGEAYDMQIYQYKEVAVVAAMGLVAGIAGRRFNVNKLGLNMYLTLIMDTGMGKDSISEFIKGTLMKLNVYGQGSSFIGASRFTGPKAVIDSLKEARCQVSVFSEAGLLLQSKAGDQIGLSRMLLGLYSASGADRWSGGEAYSKKDDALEMLRAPCLTIINEATPITLHEAFKTTQALEVGHIPRQSIFRVTGNKPFMNEHVSEGISDEHKTRLDQIMKQCQETQAQDDPKVMNIEWELGLWEKAVKYSNELTTRENAAARGGSRIDRIMLSRAFVKCMKYAAICSIYNHFDLMIKHDEWEYAKMLTEYELDGVSNFFRGSGEEDETEDLVKRIVAPCIVKYLQGNYSSSMTKDGKSDRDRGVFSAVAVRQLLKKNQELQRYAFNSGRRQYLKSGIDLILQYMLEQEYLHKANERPLKYRITRSFEIIFANVMPSWRTSDMTNVKKGI